MRGRERNERDECTAAAAGCGAEFRDRSGAILPKLTAEDLKDIGVTAVGHRRVLLDAIAALRGETPPKQENALGIGPLRYRSPLADGLRQDQVRSGDHHMGSKYPPAEPT